MALGAVADESEGVILEVVVQFGERPVGALVDDLLGASKVERLDTARLYIRASEKLVLRLEANKPT